MQKLLQQFMGITAEDMPKDAHEMAKSFVPYVEVDLKDSWEEILYSLMSGVFALFVDGFDKCILIDSRTYPSRGVEEPEKDKVLRGSKDGFVETIVFNTALIRRRIRSTELVMEMMHAGKRLQDRYCPVLHGQPGGSCLPGKNYVTGLNTFRWTP